MIYIYTLIKSYSHIYILVLDKKKSLLLLNNNFFYYMIQKT